MRAYKATIYHAGKQNHQITKHGLSAAEIVVLKAVHGDHAVVDIYDSGEEKMVHYKQRDQDGKESYFTRPAGAQDEKTYLVEKYGERIFATVFPGAMPTMPTDLSQVDIEYISAGQQASMERFAPSEEVFIPPSPLTPAGVAAEEAKSRLPKFLGG